MLDNIEVVNLAQFGGVAGTAFVVGLLVQFIFKPWIRKLTGLKPAEGADLPDDPQKKALYASTLNGVSILLATVVAVLVRFGIDGSLTFESVLLSVFTGIIAGLAATGGAETLGNFATRFSKK